jgi:hypothetical protein
VVKKKLLHQKWEEAKKKELKTDSAFPKNGLQRGAKI